ncbi:MAG: ATP-binding cassette domain-containing protein [Thermomicrobiales bacterium]
MLGLLGRPGSGKTTIARLLQRLYDPQAGAIRLGGTELRDARLAKLRTRVGIVTQQIEHFHASVRDNLTFFDRAIPDAALWDALEQARERRLAAAGAPEQTQYLAWRQGERQVNQRRTMLVVVRQIAVRCGRIGEGDMVELNRQRGASGKRGRRGNRRPRTVHDRAALVQQRAHAANAGGGLLQVLQLAGDLFDWPA